MTKIHDVMTTGLTDYRVQQVRHKATTLTMRQAAAATPIDYVQTQYWPLGRFSGDDPASAYPLSSPFLFVADSVDIGPEPAEGIYFDLNIRGLPDDNAPTDISWEIAMLIATSDPDSTYDGWHAYPHWELGDILMPAWGVPLDGPAIPWQPGPRPSGPIWLAIRGSYPAVDNTLVLHSWSATVSRLP